MAILQTIARGPRHAPIHVPLVALDPNKASRVQSRPGTRDRPVLKQAAVSRRYQPEAAAFPGGPSDLAWDYSMEFPFGPFPNRPRAK